MGNLQSLYSSPEDGWFNWLVGIPETVLQSALRQNQKAASSQPDPKETRLRSSIGIGAGGLSPKIL
jgi:hypothetical protein